MSISRFNPALDGGRRCGSLTVGEKICCQLLSEAGVKKDQKIGAVKLEEGQLLGMITDTKYNVKKIMSPKSIEFRKN